MNITIERGTCYVDSDAVLGWIATAPCVIYRTWATPCYSARGEADSPTEAIQQLLLNMWEEGGRDPELVDLLDTEFAGQEWWQEIKAMDFTA